jgi:DNA-binding MarR family transcriptional regulator
MSTLGLTPPAAFVLRSLYEHPELRFPEAIAATATAEPTLDADTVGQGLAELQERGLVEQEAGRGWRLTDAGRAATA